MTVAADNTILTFKEFVKLPDARDYELVDGRLVRRKAVGVYANFIAAEILRLLANHCHDHRAGTVFSSETLYRCFGSPNTTRKADVSFIRSGRLTDKHVSAGYFSIVPDLVVEVTSPNDKVYDLEGKLAEYKRVGVPLVWVVHPNTRTVRVFRADGSTAELTGEQQVSGESVLPGFSCRVSDFFPPFPPPSKAS